MANLSFRSVLYTLVLSGLILSALACAKRSHQTAVANDQHSPLSDSHSTQLSSRPININTASAKDIETLPGIGKGLAERIIEHREKYGPFRRAEHLIIVRGISDRRFRAVRAMITVD